jgi:uncharacterized protein YciI
MTMHFAFCYTMSDDVQRIRETVAAHVGYWETAGLANYAGGPFSDRSGGLITFDAAGLHAAAEIVARDPFVVHGLVRDHWVKEWLV